MGTIAQEIQRLQGAKADLKTAIEAKGVTVPSSTKIDGYATLVGQISGGGGNLTTLNVTPSTSAQQITPTSPVDGYDEVNVSAVTSAIDANITAGNIKNGVSILGETGNYEGDVLPATLPVGATTVQYDATHTENIASNDNIRILGSDNQRYTIAQWNAMFVAAGYNKDNMPVSPKGLSVDAFEHTGECYLFERYQGRCYSIMGTQVTAANADRLIPAMYNINLSLDAATGTDVTTNKGWSIVVNGDEVTLSEENTGQSWKVAKIGYVSKIHTVFNIHETTYFLWAVTEWMRHRMAISSGVTTTKADGTIGEITILNASGVQAAANEDMYFWVKNDSGVWVNTNILAKYNLSNYNRSTTALLTANVRDYIYDGQKAAGINMNDTGVNSGSTPVLVPGSKGAEVIAVDSEWKIITPYITNPYKNTGLLYNMADAPGVYWAIHNQCAMPSDTLLAALGWNETLVTAVTNYLNNREGWGIPVVPSSNIWSAFHESATSMFRCNTTTASIVDSTTNQLFYCVGALYLPESNS